MNRSLGVDVMVEVQIRMEAGCSDLFPAKAHDDDAAYDLHSREDLTIDVGEVKLVKTGIFMALPVGYEAQVRPRSGLALKKGVTVLNTPGTIDAGYRGEVGVIMINAGCEPFKVARGDRIAQMVIQELPKVKLVATEELPSSERGAGGFGSTGVSQQR